MGAELTKDSQGFEHLVLTSGCYNSEENTLENPEAYETLKILGFGDNDGLIKTKKVYSNLDKKVYIMKEIKINKSQEDDEDKTLSDEQKNNLIKILKSLKDDKDKCENIIKNYKIFTKGNYLYILDEYINNGDLLSYMKTYKDLNQKIKEETLWDIFLQCANALKYLHSKNIVHRNIRLENIYMANDKVIKIGNFIKAVLSEEKPTFTNPFFKNSLANTNRGEEKRFNDIVGGVFYRSPEMLSNSKYGKKTDIYSLGVVFYKLCNYDFPNSTHYTSKKKENVNNNPKMSEIIGKMLSEESKRPNAEELYDLILNEYSKIFNKNTSIEAVLRCISAYKKTTDLLLKNHMSFISEKTPFCYNYLQCIEKFKSNNEKKNCGLYLNNIRKLINKIYDKTNKDQEINPSFVLQNMLEELNRESNLNFKGPSFIIQPFDLNSSKENANNAFLNYFNNNYKSDYSRYFCGGLKTKRNCYICQHSFYNYYAIPYLEFQLDRCFSINEMTKKYQYDPKLVNWINMQYNHGKTLSIVCKTCKSKLSEFKQIEPFQHHLVITINRGEGYINKSKVEYPLEMNLKFPYDLIGIIKRISDEKGEYFISITLNFSDGKTWTLSDKETARKINNPFEHSEGDIVMLCYSFRKKN